MKNISKIIETASALAVSISMIIYGAGKTLQFPDSTAIAEKVSELSGQELMWAFYGYSKFFPLVLGALEITGGFLLLFKKTRLLAAILLSIILINVILQDIIYNINRGALIAAIIYQILIVIILVINRERVVKILTLFVEVEKKEAQESSRSRMLTALFVVFIFLLIKGFEYFVTH
jgi:hypothetical protein